MQTMGTNTSAAGRACWCHVMSPITASVIDHRHSLGQNACTWPILEWIGYQVCRAGKEAKGAEGCLTPSSSLCREPQFPTVHAYSTWPQGQVPSRVMKCAHATSHSGLYHAALWSNSWKEVNEHAVLVHVILRLYLNGPQVLDGVSLSGRRRRRWNAQNAWRPVLAVSNATQVHWWSVSDWKIHNTAEPCYHWTDRHVQQCMPVGLIIYNTGIP